MDLNLTLHSDSMTWEAPNMFDRFMSSGQKSKVKVTLEKNFNPKL